jgi:hypothetical protein
MLSYGIAACLMGLLAYKLFSWFKLNRSFTVLLYALASSAIVVNGIDSIVYFDVILSGKPTTVSPDSE